VFKLFLVLLGMVIVGFGVILLMGEFGIQSNNGLYWIILIASQAFSGNRLARIMG
jgi:hypothetical protein